MSHLSALELPEIIQGGMGVGVSGWQLARAVSVKGQLGVVSGVGLDTLMVRRLQLGDPGGYIRKALAAFPYQEAAGRVIRRFYVAGGIGPAIPFKSVHPVTVSPTKMACQLTMAANFTEVFLAKYGHDGPIGINYMEKLQMSTPAALYGAMLGGVDCVLVGAGIPSEIPELLDSFAQGRAGTVSITAAGASTTAFTTTLDPAEFGPVNLLRRPHFLAIVSSNMLASFLARDCRTRPDGFVVEGPQAGGHSARPRGSVRFNAEGEPIYGERDFVALEKMVSLGLPFWLAGGYASPKALQQARLAGAHGIQVGSAFALCDESGLQSPLKQHLIERALSGSLVVRANPIASPTGFPIKVAHIPGTLSETATYTKRKRICDVGYLRLPHQKPNGDIVYRCPGEPERAYLRKDGEVEDTADRICLCNGLISAIGLGQRRANMHSELPIVTIGADLSFLFELAACGSYKASDVIDYLLQGNDHHFEAPLRRGTDLNQGRGAALNQ